MCLVSLLLPWFSQKGPPPLPPPPPQVLLKWALEADDSSSSGWGHAAAEAGIPPTRRFYHAKHRLLGVSQVAMVGFILVCVLVHAWSPAHFIRVYAPFAGRM